MEMLCFEQTHTIRVRILNKNDNEQRLKPLSATELRLNTRELMRAMTLFEFRIEDDDMDLNEFKYRTFNDSFDVFQMNDHYGVKLSDLGYVYLVNLIETNSLIEIVCEISDGLFTNRIEFNLSINFEYDDMKSNLIAPILHTIELYENTKYNRHAKLLNVSHLVTTMTLEKKTFRLKNYENLFYVNGDYLSLRYDVKFDRESCETYELFVDDFRILVKILDLNDNAPLFRDANDLDRNGMKIKIFYSKGTKFSTLPGVTFYKQTNHILFAHLEQQISTT